MCCTVWPEFSLFAVGTQGWNNATCMLRLIIALVSREDGWMDGWMICDFTSFSTLFQSYQENGRMIVKDCVQWNPIRLKRFRLKRDSDLRPPELNLLGYRGSAWKRDLKPYAYSKPSTQPVQLRKHTSRHFHFLDSPRVIHIERKIVLVDMNLESCSQMLEDAISREANHESVVVWSDPAMAVSWSNLKILCTHIKNAHY